MSGYELWLVRASANEFAAEMSARAEMWALSPAGDADHSWSILRKAGEFENRLITRLPQPS